MRFLRPITTLMLGATLVFVPSALANSHGAKGSHAPKGPRCKHNGTSTNPAGHPNCGRHNGQSGTTDTGDPTDTNDGGDTVAAPTDDQNDQPSSADSQGDDSQS